LDQLVQIHLRQPKALQIGDVDQRVLQPERVGEPPLWDAALMGICPPSKPMKFMLPVRAFWPLPPRPAVLPVPLACPRPTLFFSFTPPPRGGVSRVSSFIAVTSSDQPRSMQSVRSLLL